MAMVIMVKNKKRGVCKGGAPSDGNSKQSPLASGGVPTESFTGCCGLEIWWRRGSKVKLRSFRGHM